MIKYTAVLPFVHEPYLKECQATLKLPAENLVIIDGRAAGLAASINKAIKVMQDNGDDWLIVLNPALRFGEPGGLDMLDYLKKSKGLYVYFLDNNGDNLAWHCCAINREVFEIIGKLDPNFHPVYFEDIDFDLRYKKEFADFPYETCQIDVDNESMGHSTKLAGIKVNTDYLIAYFATKWGKHPMAESIQPYDWPFNDQNNSLAFWPPAWGQLWNE